MATSSLKVAARVPVVPWAPDQPAWSATCSNRVCDGTAHPLRSSGMNHQMVRSDRAYFANSSFITGLSRDGPRGRRSHVSRTESTSGGREVDQAGSSLGGDGPVPVGPGCPSGLRPGRSCPFGGGGNIRAWGADEARSAATHQPLDRVLVRFQAQGGQGHDRAGAIRPVVNRRSCLRRDPGQLRPPGRGPSPRRGDRTRGPRIARADCQTRRTPGHARQPRDRHRAAEPPREAARAVDRAIRGRLEVGNRRQCRAPHPRAAKRDQRASQCHVR